MALLIVEEMVFMAALLVGGGLWCPGEVPGCVIFLKRKKWPPDWMHALDLDR